PLRDVALQSLHLGKVSLELFDRGSGASERVNDRVPCCAGVVLRNLDVLRGGAASCFGGFDHRRLVGRFALRPRSQRGPVGGHVFASSRWTEIGETVT